ncbi:MAG: hypothetical protein Ta2B_01320 [Termitinemataceae bacterium]|nr:MAG: hypothetical protein Ta2B_01320 [Termitinemataceae bacterium]
MAVEIELKAWVDDPCALKTKINAIAEYKTAYTKEDIYYISDPNAAAKNTLPISGVRIRTETVCDAQHNESTTVLVTYKTKELRNKIEINDEKEFAICDIKRESTEQSAIIFEDLLQRLGLIRGVCKKKVGKLWKKDSINVELSLVENLGTFLELEIIVEQGSDSATIEKSRNQLLNFLSLCGISQNKIEPRYYAEMLKGLSANETNSAIEQ